jgi:hypothetical protein
MAWTSGTIFRIANGASAHQQRGLPPIGQRNISPKCANAFNLLS